MTLNSHERVRNLLHGERVDRPPCGEFFISDEFIRAFLAPTPIGAVEFQHHHAVVQQLDLDIASVSFSGGWGALEQPDENRALDLLSRWSAEGNRYTLALIDGPFSAAVRARGFNELVHYIGGAPHVAHDLFAHGADETRIVAQAMRDAGADGVILGEDIAYGHSTFIGPHHLRDLYFGELHRAAQEIHALGLSVFFHSDGNLNAVLDSLAACELDGIQGLEPEAGMTVSAVRQRVGPAITLWGNLGFDFLSGPRTEAEIAGAVSSLVPESANEGPSGKIILGSCAGLVQGMNIETVRRVYQAVTTRRT